MTEPNERSPTNPASSWGPTRSFGRIRSRTLKPRQAELFTDLLPQLELTDDRLARLLESKQELWLEIGFGGGEHMAAQALKNPLVTLIGCEPFLNGVGSALRHIDDGKIDNIAILPNDVRPLLDKLPDRSLSQIFILFPDPWPKSRHNKRRLIQPELVTALARVLKSKGRVRFATDWADYANEALQRFIDDGGFAWVAKNLASWTEAPIDHVTTRYELKGLGDCQPVFFDFMRR